MRRATTWAAWALWTFDIVAVCVVFLVHRKEVMLADVTGLLFILVFATTGSLVASRIPSNPAGWLMCLAALSVTVGGLCEFVYAHVDQSSQPGTTLATAAAWLTTWVWMAGIAPAATFLLLFFPDGHLPSRRWRPVAWACGITIAALLVALATEPGRIQSTDVVNPLGIPAPGLIAAVLAVTGVLLVVGTVLCCTSLVVRYRSAAAEQRQQLKWLAWAVPIVLVFVLASILVQSDQSNAKAVDLGNALTALGLSVVPIAIGLAILRSRLYDIDLVINRTLVYATLTVTLALVYLASVLLIRLAVEPLTGRSDLAVAASTLSVAALFRPLRSRIQTVVDQRFYRRRYDAARTLQSFSGRLRQEVDLDTVTSDLRAVVRDTVQPAHVTLWLRRQERLP